MRRFPVGYRDFHPDPTINFPLNRWLPYWDEAEVAALSKSIHSLEDWNPTMRAHAETADQEGRTENAAFFYRATEFFTDWSEDEKHDLYRSFLERFYAGVSESDFEACDVSFDGGSLPTLAFAPKTSERGCLVIHGGFDSAMEEFFDMAQRFAGDGYWVILFEGPGQGRVLHESGLTMTPDWHRPTSAVLDHFGVSSCSLIGISLGGCLALRAAARDPRIERVILCDVLEDFYDCMTSRLPGAARGIIDRLSRWGADAPIDWALDRAGRQAPFTRWALQHGMAVSGTASFADYLRWMRTMNTHDVSSAITQDVLILAGAEDHLVPLRQLGKQVDLLTSAGSITTRVFSEAEQAHNHCQIGNLDLMLDVVRDWLSFQFEHAQFEHATAVPIRAI